MCAAFGNHRKNKHLSRFRFSFTQNSSGVGGGSIDVGGASCRRATGLLDALGPRVEQLGHRVFVRQLQQFGRHGSVDLQQEAVGSCWEGDTTLFYLRAKASASEWP